MQINRNRELAITTAFNEKGKGMIKRKPKIDSTAESNTQKQAGTAKKISKKKVPAKKTQKNTDRVPSSIRSQYISYIENPDTPIDRQKIISQIKSFDNKDVNFQAVLLSIEVTESFRQFGYQDIKGFIEKEIKHSYKNANRILNQAKIAFDAGGLDAVGKYTGNALDAMKELEADERKEVLSFALKSNPKAITRTVIVQAMTELGHIEEISPQHKKTKDKISQIHNKIKKSETRPEFLKNLADALHENLKTKDIDSIVTKLNKLK